MGYHREPCAARTREHMLVRCDRVRFLDPRDANTNNAALTVGGGPTDGRCGILD